MSKDVRLTDEELNRQAPLGEPQPPGFFDIASGQLRALPFEADAVVAVIE